VGLSWISGYLLTQIYTPILFYIHGAGIAGQMGLTLTITTTLGLLTQSWLTHKVPMMANLAGKKAWSTLDQIFKHHFILSLSLYILGALSLCFFYILFSHWFELTRVLTFWEFAGLLVIEGCNQIMGSIATQLRAYKKEPLAGFTFLSTAITLPFAVLGAIHFRAQGVILAILSVQIVFSLPITFYIFKKYNRLWRIEQ
jgi:hypothetical protein